MKKTFMNIMILELMFSFALTPVFASSQSVLSGLGQWSGGISKNKVYSRVTDQKNDGYKISVRVWVKNDKGATYKKLGTTTGLGKRNSVYIDTKATNNNPFVTNKSGYNGARAV